MSDLIAYVSSGAGTWAHLRKVMDGENWEQIFLIISPLATEKFTHKKSFAEIKISEDLTITELKEFIKSQLSGKVHGMEVGVNIVSGTGKEHTALLLAIMELGFGMRFVYATKDGISIV